MTTQKYSSKDTCLNQVAAIYNKFQFPKGSRVLDYGGGRYDKAKQYMAENGVEVMVYDKYNRTPDHNAVVMAKAKQNTPDYVVCSNVLNVIAEDEIVDEVLFNLASFTGSTVLITVYEGNGTGVGKVTTKGYQRNAKLCSYLPMVEKYFVVQKRNGVLICTGKRGESEAA